MGIFEVEETVRDASLPPSSASGHEGVGRERVSEIQRARILVAMIDVVAQRGVSKTTVAHIVARSGVSRRTFYELFDDREECFLAAFEQAIARLAAVVVPAYEQAPRWRAGLRAALTVLLETLDFEPSVSRVVIVETLGAGPTTLARRQRVLGEIVAVVDRGRSEAGKGTEPPPPLTADGVVGGALSLVHSRLVEGEGEPLLGLVNPLMSMIVLPYLGSAAARRELKQPVRRTLDPTRSVGTDLLRELDMRLTYRTVCVLLAIGAQPGASNREVADSSDIRDQGQISKLLNRLEHLGLIENAGDSQAKGERNAWKLTEQGASVREAMSVRGPWPHWRSDGVPSGRA